MQGELECEGLIRFGSLPWEISERLTNLNGTWLRYSPEDNALVVNHELPAGCPAMTGVCCELISFIYTLPEEVRRAMPGGTLHVRGRSGPILRLTVENGDVRVQWPQSDYSGATDVELADFMKESETRQAKIRGWARFVGDSARNAEIQALIDRFSGVFPEGDLPSECPQNVAFVEFRDAAGDPEELLNTLASLAEPGSLDAELNVRRYTPDLGERQIRVLVEGGRTRSLRPTPWK